MKRLRLIIFLYISILSACQTAETGADEHAVENLRETHEITPPLPVLVHNEVAIERHFTSRETKDLFRLTLHGSKSYADADLCFVILNQNLDTLFSRKTKGKALIAAIDSEMISGEEKQKELILERMSTFFAETGFSYPPYTLNDPGKSGITGDKELWEEIKNDTTAWCFEFALHEEGAVEILAYSKNRDTILVYDCSK